MPDDASNKLGPTRVNQIETDQDIPRKFEEEVAYEDPVELNVANYNVQSSKPDSTWALARLRVFLDKSNSYPAYRVTVSRDNTHVTNFTGMVFHALGTEY